MSFSLAIPVSIGTIGNECSKTAVMQWTGLWWDTKNDKTRSIYINNNNGSDFTGSGTLSCPYETLDIAFAMIRDHEDLSSIYTVNSISKYGKLTKIYHGETGSIFVSELLMTKDFEIEKKDI